MSDRKEFFQWFSGKDWNEYECWASWQAARQPRFTEEKLVDIVAPKTGYNVATFSVAGQSIANDTAKSIIQALKEAGVIRVKGKEDAGN